jgi:hypothetical protein
MMTVFRRSLFGQERRPRFCSNSSDALCGRPSLHLLREDQEDHRVCRSREGSYSLKCAAICLYVLSSWSIKDFDLIRIYSFNLI